VLCPLRLLPARRRGRPAKPETELLAEIKQIIAGQPAYGYRRVHALIRRSRHQQSAAAVNVKRVYRIMKADGLLSSATPVRAGSGMMAASPSIGRTPDGARTRLRQWRAGQDRLHLRLLRP
jgi:putative transposase